MGVVCCATHHPACLPALLQVDVPRNAAAPPSTPPTTRPSPIHFTIHTTAARPLTPFLRPCTPAATLLSCAEGNAVLSTAPGMPSAITSPNGLYALVLQRSGRVEVRDQSTGELLTTITGPFSSCTQPLK